MRQIGSHFYNLDSKLKAPEVIGEQKELIDYLKEQIQCKDKELLIVVSAECAKQDKWYSTTHLNDTDYHAAEVLTEDTCNSA